KLATAIKQATFREDLFYRLNVVSIHVPALRERATDIPELVDHFLKKYTAASGKTVKGVTNGALRLLMDYPWPGNVRELESVIERAVLLCEAERIDVGDLPAEVRSRVTLLAQLDFELPAEGFSLEGFSWSDWWAPTFLQPWWPPAHQQKIGELEAKVNAAETEKSALLKKVTEVSQAADDCKAQSNQMAKAQDDLKARVDQLQAALADAQAKLQSMSKPVKKGKKK